MHKQIYISCLLYNPAGLELRCTLSSSAILLTAGNFTEKDLIMSRSIREKERRKVKRTLSAIRISVIGLHKITLPMDIGLYSYLLGLCLVKTRHYKGQPVFVQSQVTKQIDSDGNASYLLLEMPASYLGPDANFPGIFMAFLSPSTQISV